MTCGYQVASASFAAIRREGQAEQANAVSRRRCAKSAHVRPYLRFFLVARGSRSIRGANMGIRRLFTTEGQSAYEGVPFHKATSEIRNPDGSVVFRQSDIEVPEAWSQVASDVMAQKYFRRAGVAARLKRVEENDVPSFLWRQVPDTDALGALPEAERKV